MLKREEVLEVKRDFEMRKVEVPEWGGEIYVRTMTSEKRALFEAMAKDEGNAKAMAREKITIWTACDDTGQMIFKDADAQALSQRSSLVLDRIVEAALKVNTISREDVEEIQKNSGKDPTA